MGALRVDVDKFGGKTASVAKPIDYESAGSMTIVRDIVKTKIKEGKKVVMVISAFSKTTDYLVGLEEMIRAGEIVDENQVKGYLNEFVRKPHEKLANDLNIPLKSTINMGFNPVYNEVVESANALIRSKNKFSSSDSMLGVYSPMPFMMAFLSYLEKRNTSIDRIVQEFDIMKEYIGARDHLVTAGERMILPFYKNFMNHRRSRLIRGTEAITIPAEKIFYTDGKYGSANIDTNLSLGRVKGALLPALMDNSVKVVIVPGFYGATKGGSITCFGRGGSDLTAVALAYFLSLIPEIKVEGPCLTKDTNGIMVVNPKEIYSTTNKEKGNIPSTDVPLVPYTGIPQIDNLNYSDAMEIEAVHAGAVQFANKHGMTINIKKISDYFGSKASTISGNKTTSGYKLIGGTKDSILFETRGTFKDEPGESYWFGSILYKYGINVSKFMHYIGDTILVLDRGNERLPQAMGEMEKYMPIGLKECSLVRASGDVLASDRTDFENIGSMLGAHVLSPFVRGYNTLSTAIPKFPERDGIDFYRAALTAYYDMWYDKQMEHTRKIITKLRNTFLKG